MASADVFNELNSQLKADKRHDSSEAEKISVVESNVEAAKGEASGNSKKTKKKGGLFKRIKNAVTGPLRKKSNSAAQQQNGKLRTKSTSDLTDEKYDESEAGNDHGSKTKV